MKVVVVIPTYNERENIASLIFQLEEQFLSISHEMHILVVDDSSPDGTQDIVEELARTRPFLHLLSGRKAGLGRAYIRGMQHAIEELGADVVFEMDADFSHDPRDVPRLLVNIEHGADLVIGSRYVPGGSIPAEWGTLRKLNSKYGNVVARHIAGMPNVRDCTAGFRAIRAGLLKKIDLGRLRVQGYAFQVALLYEAIVNGARVVEFPVHFTDRRYGTSKLGIEDIIEFVMNAWWIRVRASSTLLKFLLVGASGVAVNLGVFTLLLVGGMNKFLASPVAIEASIVTNFLLNNYWTFRRRKSRDRVRIKGLKFNLVSFGALAISYTTFVLLSVAFPDVWPQLHQLIGIVPATIFNYLLNSYWTFREEATDTGARSAESEASVSQDALGRISGRAQSVPEALS